MVDQLRNSEANVRRIAHVEACFGTNGQPLKMDNRVLIGEGVLVKICRKKPKSRQFFLFNDILVYGSIIIPSKRYNKQHIIPLEDVMIEDINACEGVQNGWLIKTKRKSFVVYAATVHEKREWIVHIQRCIDSLLNDGIARTTNHAAPWIPDSEANKCMCCRASQFSVVNRRHHCRACGIVVCSRCSSKSFLLEGISKKPVRVCDLCYNKLCNGMTTSRPTSAIFPSSAPLPTTATHNQCDDYSSDYSDEEGEEDNDQNTSNLSANAETPTFYSPSSSNLIAVKHNDKEVIEVLI